MMLLFSIGILVSCIENNNIPYKDVVLEIDTIYVPDHFKFGTIDTIHIAYSLPDDCSEFRSVYYQYQDTARILAINALMYDRAICVTSISNRVIKFPIEVFQMEAFVFKLWKGEGVNGVGIYQEIVVPVEY
ncbi:conserved hypothetical protein [Tenacibaculum xiamenense]